MADTEKIRHPEPQITREKNIPTKEYGLLKVWEWPDGTVVHINTEKGKESMRVYHSSGTYDEYTGKGNRIHFSSNNELRYQKGGVTVTFDNNMDTKGSGHSRLSIDHDTHIEVKKNASIAVAGTADIVSVGHVKVAATDIYLGATKGSIVLNAARDIEIKAGSRVMVDSGAATQITANGDIHIETQQDAVIKAQQNISNKAQSNFTVDAQSDVGINAKGKLSAKSGSDAFVEASSGLNLKGSDVKVGGGSKVEVNSGSNLATPPWVSGGSAPSGAPQVKAAEGADS